MESLGTEASRLHGRGQMTLGSADSIYESALLNLVTAFEVFLEELFYSVLLNASQMPDAGGAVTFRDRVHAEEVLLGGRQYLDWMPFDLHTIPRGKRLLIESPFSRLERHPDERAFLRELIVVRNAIAHESGTARTKFQSLTTGLRPRRRTPAGLLQDVRQGSSVLSDYSTQLRVIVKALAAPTARDSKRLLSPENPYEQGAAAGKGRFQCVTCGAVTVMSANRSTLPACAVCTPIAVSRIRKTRWRRQY